MAPVKDPRPRRRRRNIPADLIVIKRWKADKETQVEDDDTTWTTEQYRATEAFKADLLEFTLRIFAPDNPSSPDPIDEEEAGGQHEQDVAIKIKKEAGSQTEAEDNTEAQAKADPQAQDPEVEATNPEEAREEPEEKRRKLD